MPTPTTEPYDYPSPTRWQEFLTRRDNGERLRITGDMFQHWMHCLPPKAWKEPVRLANGTHYHPVFGFAEGDEPITAFWQQGHDFYCQKTIEYPGRFDRD